MEPKSEFTIIERIIHFAELLAHIPNVPFLHGPLLNKITDILIELGIDHNAESASSDSGVFAYDDYCLYVHFKKGKPVKPLLIDSHIDHPGFVLNDDGEGIAFGSVGYRRVEKLLQIAPIDLRIFDPSGNFLTKGHLTHFNSSSARIETSIPVPKNSYGLWNVTDFAIDDDKFVMHAADNMIATYVMLALIEHIIQHQENYRDLDVTFVFTFLEEVFEVSASALAMKRHTPFGYIDNDWIIIVLESMQAVPLSTGEDLVISQELSNRNLRNLRLDDDDVAYAPGNVQSKINSESIHKLYNSLDLPLPDYESGVMIKINDTDCIYGYSFMGQFNNAESILLQAADDLGTNYQHTLSGGACNGTAYSLFPTSSHIATLNIPNALKHNIASDGKIVPEQVKVSDVAAAANIMRKVLEYGADYNHQVHPKAVTHSLKKTDLVPDQSVTQRLQAERGAISWSFRLRLRKKRYFGVTPIENAQFRIRAATARVRESVLTFRR